MVRNLSFNPEGGQSPEKELFKLLKQNNPSRFKAVKTIKPALLTAGFLFGVVIFLILIQEPTPDYTFALQAGIGVSIIGVAFEYLAWKILAKSMLKNLKKEISKNS